MFKKTENKYIDVRIYPKLFKMININYSTKEKISFSKERANRRMHRKVHTNSSHLILPFDV